VTGLLEKDGVGAVDLADVDLDVLRVGEGVVQEECACLLRTPLLLPPAVHSLMTVEAAQMSKRGEPYCVLASCVTLRMTIRGLAFLSAD
jgi:hypothetical protein